MILLFILLLWSPLLIVRGLRWLAILQQKEYRLDRLIAFFRSKEGQRDFFHFWPQATDFTRTGLKRPRITTRILLVACLSCFMMMLVIMVGWLMMQTNSSEQLIMGLAVGFGLELFLPLIILIANWPTVLAAELLTFITLVKARRLIGRAKPIVIGITGSYGKTSTKLLLAAVLSAKYKVFVTPKSYNTRYSVAKSIVDGYCGQEIVILEYGAYGVGEIKTLTRWFKPHIAMVTGLAPQHLELFGSVERIMAAKSELPKALPAGAPVFCHAADPGARQICQLASQAEMIAYTGPDSQVNFNHIGLTHQGQLTFVWKGHTIITALIGQHYLANVAGVIAVAEHLQLKEYQIVEQLSHFQPTANFIRLLTNSKDTWVIDDGGATNPTGFAVALDLINWYRQHYSARRLTLITGGIIDLGHQSSQIHRQLAKQAKTNGVDQVFYLGQAGQPEFSQVFAHQMVTDPAQVQSQLLMLNQNDIVIIEGRVPLWVYQKLAVKP